MLRDAARIMSFEDSNGRRRLDNLSTHWKPKVMICGAEYADSLRIHENLLEKYPDRLGHARVTGFTLTRILRNEYKDDPVLK